MKKKNLLFNTIISTIAIPSAINFFIFHKAKNKTKKTEGQYYNWKYGKVFYSIKGSGEPLLLIHSIGAGCQSLEWNRNIDTLSKYYEVYTIDLIGFGRSDRPNMTYTAYIYSQLIIDFIENIVQTPVNVIASSLSGAFTVMSYNLSPELFKKILLISPSGVGSTDTTFNKNDRLLRFFINSPLIGTSVYIYMTSKKCFKKYLSENIFFDENDITDEILEEYYYFSHNKNASSKYAIASLLSNYMNVNIESALANIDLPIYVVWGKNAKKSPLANLEIIKRINANIQYAIFDQTKMLPHSENAREFNKICKEFFE